MTSLSLARQTVAQSRCRILLPTVLITVMLTMGSTFAMAQRLIQDSGRHLYRAQINPALGAVRLGQRVGKSAPRSPSVRREFQRRHPCPSTGRRTGPCNGFVVDHVVPLCKGGLDAISNMEWQRKAEAKAKDRWECK